ncbi:hypothetical protein MRB53_005840 [Persea americana]|uniref:Uncharacterized protein n=1 Tax=Persea americana TaxID=3435 RepID=A0ACC2MEG6_PERAE|nr:hypothetical protein MRB53_005840 [Persea americana]
MCSVLQKHVFAYPPVFPVGIDDLLLGPPAGVFPTRGGFGIGGGMLVGPDDPRWQEHSLDFQDFRVCLQVPVLTLLVRLMSLDLSQSVLSCLYLNPHLVLML